MFVDYVLTDSLSGPGSAVGLVYMFGHLTF